MSSQYTEQSAGKHWLVFYLTPVVYPLATVPEKWRHLLELNPLTGLVQLYRAAFLGGELPAASTLAPLLVAAPVALALGLSLPQLESPLRRRALVGRAFWPAARTLGDLGDDVGIEKGASKFDVPVWIRISGQLDGLPARSPLSAKNGTPSEINPLTGSTKPPS